ncbi:hypothetical protein BYT27DRAFT_7202682 [Phlegmacium glaucopus]|nr:hypothetical protein BYT27DRAFT_7202682 [Phlegmacium glaucopus]
MARKLYASAIALTLVGAGTLVILLIDLSFSPDIADNASNLSLLILLVQVLVAAVSVLASSLASYSLWAQLSFASISKSGLPLQALDRASKGPFSSMATWHVGPTGRITTIPQFALRLLVSTWLGTAIIPRVGIMPWYSVQSSTATSLNDVATSLATNNCYTSEDQLGLNLGSCNSVNWMIGTVASVFLGKLVVSGNTYNSGCNPNYPSNRDYGCVQNLVAGLSPLQTVVSIGNTVASSNLPSFQVNLNCDFKSMDVVGNPSTQEHIWMSTGSDNSSFTLNIFGQPNIDTIDSNVLLVASCGIRILSGTSLWTQDPSMTATAAGVDPSLNTTESPALLLSQFSTLISFANSTGMGFSWSPLLKLQHGGDFNSDPSPLGQIFNAILAGLLNRAYVDSVLHPTVSSSLFVSKTRVHFARGAAKWICVAGAVVIISSSFVIIFATWRISGTRGKAPYTLVDVGQPSVWLASRIVKSNAASVAEVPIDGEGDLTVVDRLVVKWRSDLEGGLENTDTGGFVLLDERGNEDKWPVLQSGRRYFSRGDINVRKLHE